MFGIEIPIVQGLISSFIYSGIKLGGKKLFSNGISEQFITAILDAFDKLSEKHPVKKLLDGYTFWDFVASRMAEELSHKDFSEEQINAMLVDVLEELLVDEENKRDLESINKEFWYLLNCEVILHNELYKYLLLSRQQEMNSLILSIRDNVESLSDEANKQVPVEANSIVHEDNLVDYFIGLHQLFIKEIGSEFLARKFKNVDNTEKSLLEIDEIINSDNNVIILGEPGSGKTYITKRMLYELTFKKDSKVKTKIPIYLNLVMFGFKYDTIAKGIEITLENYIEGINSESTKELLREGQFIILLDGLDEVKREFYELCISELKDMMQHKPQNQYIITCRENMYLDELNYLVKRVKLVALDKLQIESALKQYSGIASYELNNEHYELFENPLLLNIGLEVIKNHGGRLPENRSLMFNKYFEFLCYKWERKKGLKRNYSLSYFELIKFLSNIAFKKFNKPFLTKIEIQEELFKEYPSEDIELAFDQIINIGIFNYYHSADEVWFSHKTFKEYLAGKYIVGNIENSNNGYDFINNVISNKQWYEVFVFASGLFTSWEEQNYFLDYVLEKNLKMYVDCIGGKNDFNSYLLSLSAKEYSTVYLKSLVTTYEKIIEKYFYQIKKQFDPYRGLINSIDNPHICILGNISEDKKHLHFTFIVEESSCDKVALLPPKEFFGIIRNSTIHISSSVNLELSNLMGDSARIIALKQIRAQVSNILKEYRLNENFLLISERVHEIKRSLPKEVRNYDILKLHQWVKKKFEEVKQLTGEPVERYSYNGIELAVLSNYLNYLQEYNIDYKNCLLPKSDIIPSNSSYVWDFYSKDQLLKRVEKFFCFYKETFTYLIENNFSELKNYLPDYVHLPYKYIIELKFNSEHTTEPLMSYYYIGIDSNKDNKPEIRILDKRKRHEEQGDLIEKSFKGKERFTNIYSVCGTGVMMTMYERRSGKELPLLSNSYKLVKDNLQRVLGKL